MPTDDNLQLRIARARRRHTLDKYKNLIQNTPGITFLDVLPVIPSQPMTMLWDVSLVAVLSMFDIEANRFITEAEIDAWLRHHFEENDVSNEILLNLGILDGELNEHVWLRVHLDNQYQWIPGIIGLSKHLTFYKPDANWQVTVTTDENANLELHIDNEVRRG